jgi:hypothetical protein
MSAFTPDPVSTPPPGPPAPSRQAWLARVSAVGAAFLLAAFATVSTSRAAFTTTTANTGNTASAAGIALTDGDTGVAMFSLSGLYPGQSYSKCIDVTYTGNALSTPIKLYRSSAVTGTGLEQYLDLVVDWGTGTAGTTGGATSNCTGFNYSGNIYTGNTLQTFMTTYQAWGSGLSTIWQPTSSPQTRYFRVTLTMQDNNAAQGKDVTFGFTWEAQL